jgi:hypothetical protein
MAASASQRKIDQVLTSARKELESQLGVVRAEMARLAADEQELTAALANLSTDGSASTSRDGASRRRSSSRKQAAKRSRRSGNGRRAGGRRAASKSTAERVEEVRALLADGPKSRNELAAALKVSPARVQQLLGELGGSVSSQPDGDKRAKLWTISGASDRASASKPKRGGRQAKKATATKSRRRTAAAG